LTVSGEGFGQGPQLARAPGFGKFLNGDFVRGGATLEFEGVTLDLEGLDGFQEGGALGGAQSLLDLTGACVANARRCPAVSPARWEK
jgi:hypothetical protein